jgi:hypothetical protein
MFYLLSKYTTMSKHNTTQKNRTAKLFQALSASLLTALLASNSFAETVVIGHPSVDTIDAAVIKKMFMGKMKTFPNGSPVTPIDQAKDSPIRDQFYAVIAGKNPQQMHGYWAAQIFSGKSKPPRSVSGDLIVRNMVASNEDLIGYIDSKNVDETVKVLYTLE